VRTSRAAVDQDVLAGLLLELGYPFGDVSLDEGRVDPLQRLFQGRGDDVLEVAVHPIGVALLVGGGRPGGGENFVGHPSQQEGVGRGRLVELVLPHLVAPVREVPLIRQLHLHHAVERHELRNDHPSHVKPPFRCGI